MLSIYLLEYFQNLPRAICKLSKSGKASIPYSVNCKVRFGFSRSLLQVHRTTPSPCCNITDHFALKSGAVCWYSKLTKPTEESYIAFMHSHYNSFGIGLSCFRSKHICTCFKYNVGFEKKNITYFIIPRAKCFLGPVHMGKSYPC